MGASEETIHRNMGVLFGGVTDEDTGEETMESVFHNDLYGYQTTGNGRWVSMMLKKSKKKAGQKKKSVAPAPQPVSMSDEEDGDDDDGGNEIEVERGLHF